jgi:hypothetical protein
MAIRDGRPFVANSSNTGNYNSPILRRANLQYASKFNVGWEYWPGKTGMRNKLADNGSFRTDKLASAQQGCYDWILAGVKSRQ